MISKSSWEINSSACAFHGLPVGRISSPFLTLEYLTTAGPRIVRLMRTGTTQNLLAETPDISWKHRCGEYHLRGGHRLWRAPECIESSLPDDDPPQVESLQDRVSLTQPLEALTRLRKRITILLHPDRPAVTVEHTLRNEGPQVLLCAAWGITLLPGGGEAVIPLSDQALPLDPAQPDRKIVLWPYASLRDQRLRLEDDLIHVACSKADAPFKIGALNPLGSIEYRYANGITFRKTFSAPLDQPYPDMGCNCAVYTRRNVIELESMSALVKLDQGQEIQHTEVWEIDPLH